MAGIGLTDAAKPNSEGPNWPGRARPRPARDLDKPGSAVSDVSGGSVLRGVRFERALPWNDAMSGEVSSGGNKETRVRCFRRGRVSSKSELGGGPIPPERHATPLAHGPPPLRYRCHTNILKTHDNTESGCVACMCAHAPSDLTLALP